MCGARSGTSPGVCAPVRSDSAVSGRISTTMASDPCSFSSFTRCVTRHLNLHLHVDFDRHVIRAKVELTVEALEDRFTALVTLTEPGALR